MINFILSSLPQLSTYPNGTPQRFCGTPYVPFTWESTGNICEIHFQSDSFVTKPGYRGTYEAFFAPDTLIASTTTTEAPTGKRQFVTYIPVRQQKKKKKLFYGRTNLFLVAKKLILLQKFF